MAGLSRPKGRRRFRSPMTRPSTSQLWSSKKYVDARVKPGHDEDMYLTRETWQTGAQSEPTGRL